MVEESGPFKAYKTLRDHPRIRESLRIHPMLWKRLSEAIQNKIRAIREKLDAERTEQPKPNYNNKSIPPQYGLNRNTKNSVKEESNVDS